VRPKLAGLVADGNCKNRQNGWGSITYGITVRKGRYRAIVGFAYDLRVLVDLLKSSQLLVLVREELDKALEILCPSQLGRQT
jgi:hypothetical protein